MMYWPRMITERSDVGRVADYFLNVVIFVPFELGVYLH
jgi:hypothetical protein